MPADTDTIVETNETLSLDLLGRAQSGDAPAFCELCRSFEPRLLGQAISLCHDAALAEDLAQDTLVEAWRSLHRYNGRCRFFTWLCAILLHRYHNARRAKRPVPISVLSPHEFDGACLALERLVDSAASPDMAAQRGERDLLLRRSLNQLSPKHREVIHLRFFVDHSLDGVAAALNCSVGTVKSRLFHALEQMRALLVKQQEREEL